jgi:hypothetical protein
VQATVVNTTVQTVNTEVPGGVRIVGGFSNGNIKQLTTFQQMANDFILQSVPELQTWTVVKVKSQVVSG